jgi:hypothetical protein
MIIKIIYNYLKICCFGISVPVPVPDTLLIVSPFVDGIIELCGVWKQRV